MTAASQPLIQGVADTTREMLQSMDEIVWAINPRNDTLENAINYLIHYTRDFLRPAGIPYKLDMPVNLPDLLISTEIRHNLFMAFQRSFEQCRQAWAPAPHPARLGLGATSTESGRGGRWLRFYASRGPSGNRRLGQHAATAEIRRRSLLGGERAGSGNHGGVSVAPAITRWFGYTFSCRLTDPS